MGDGAREGWEQDVIVAASPDYRIHVVCPSSICTRPVMSTSRAPLNKATALAPLRSLFCAELRLPARSVHHFSSHDPRFAVSVDSCPLAAIRYARIVQSR